MLIIKHRLLSFVLWAASPPVLATMPDSAANNHITYTSEEKIVADTTDDFDYFGAAVSLSGDRALVSAYLASGRGYAYLFEFNHINNQWIQETRLRTLLYGDLNDDFGRSVSLQGNRALIGAPGDDEFANDSGGAYIFEYDATKDLWNEQPRLSPNDRQPGDFFGWDVSIHEDLAIIGARLDDEDIHEDLGSAYIFQYDDTKQVWNEVTKLLPSDRDTELRYGNAVSIHGQWAFVGANLDDTNGNRAGVVYVYLFDNQLQQWQEFEKLYPETAVADAFFGHDIAYDGNSLLIGAPFDRNGSTNSGAAYVFEYDELQQSWLQAHKLSASDGASSDAFGVAVGINQDRIVVGAYRDDDGGDASGSAYVFIKQDGTWLENNKLTASDGAGDAYFGSGVAINQNFALVGAEQDDEAGVDSGAAYFFSSDVIYASGFDYFIPDCAAVTIPAGLTVTNGVYRDYNGQADFGTSTNTTFLANLSTSEILSLADFTMSTPNFRRRFVFSDAPSNYNLMGDATVSISLCPGDFTATASCVMPVNNLTTLFFSNRPEDENSPTPYCILDSSRSYFYNLIMSPDPMNVAPECENPANTSCAAFGSEAVLPQVD